MNHRAFCLLSGGIDSSTVLAMAVQRHGAANVQALSVDYGQRHRRELNAACMLAEHFKVKHDLMVIEDMPRTALTDHDIDIPRVAYSDIKGVSPSYVPFRNGQFLSKAAARASAWCAEGAKGSDYSNDRSATIYIGTHAEDAAGDAYPDCRLDFIGAMGAAIYIGTYHKVRVAAPLIAMFKPDIILAGQALQVPWLFTWSCYLGGHLHCGTCPTCRARREGFALAKIKDPTQYESLAA